MRDKKFSNDRNKFGKKPQAETPFKPTTKKFQATKDGDDQIRLNKFIANSGVCSRREADKLIANGEVTVNGEVVTELGAKVSLSDDVQFKGQSLNVEKKVYVLLNKPRGFVTTLDDPHAEHTVMELVASACTERIYPVGRLDKETSGVLLFTNDGELAKKLTHPSFEKKKIYHVFLNEDFTDEDLEKVRTGIELEDGFIKADSISLVDPEDRTQVGIEIHSGRNRIVRRIFAHLGFKVARLDRVFFAGLTKKNLPRGRYRHLTPKEISFLKMN